VFKKRHSEEERRGICFFGFLNRAQKQISRSARNDVSAGFAGFLNTPVSGPKRGTTMILRIDTTISLPVYAQIVDQIKRAIASGSLKAGDGLTSLRETALKLRINPLTVAKAYKQLEQDGLIETKHGLGSFVTADTGATDAFRRETLARGIDNLIVDAFQMGVAPDELKGLFAERVQAANDSLIEEDGR
jgi:GntR family transcriptional regulator